ncbi:MAG: inorganic phosphate transporter [Chloroflexota bacterium]
MAALAPFLVLVAIQDMLTGILGAPGIISTLIASRAMSARRAIYLSTITQLLGPLVFGVAVASVIGSEVIESQAITPVVLYAALSSTVIWMLVSWLLRIPSSSTHALIGGLLGAVLIALGPAGVHGSGLLKILLSLTLTAPLGIIGGFLVMHGVHWLSRRPNWRIHQHSTRRSIRRIERRFNQGQYVASLFLGLAIGSNNAQNAMGITALGLLSTGFSAKFEIPLWVIIGSAACLALGNLVGGTRLINSVGGQFFSIQPIHGFSAEVSSALIIGVSSLVGGNVSTTHVTSMSIIGAGAAESLSTVRWRFVRRVLLVWVITIPSTALLAGLFYSLFNAISIR